MRNCTNQQNAMNGRPSGKSKYLGVSYNGYGAYKGAIVAHIRIYGKRMYLGNFQTEEDAARAYNDMAIKLFGEFANLNIIK